MISSRAAPNCDHAVANLRTDRAAAAGDHDRSALEEAFEPRVIDLHARPQQQVLDIDRRQARRLAAVFERGQPSDGKPEAARVHQGCFRLGLGREGAGGENHAGNRRAALRAVVHHAVEGVEAAENRNAADRLPLVGRGRRQDADRPDLLDRAALDRPQQDFGVRGAPKHERRIGLGRPRVMSGAGIAVVAVGDPRPAEKHHLQDPIERDGDFAEEELPEHVRRHQHVVEHQQRDRQQRHGAKDVHQIGKRGEAPLRFVEMEHEIDDPGIDDETGQERE